MDDQELRRPTSPPPPSEVEEKSFRKSASSARPAPPPQSPSSLDPNQPTNKAFDLEGARSVEGLETKVGELETKSGKTRPSRPAPPSGKRPDAPTEPVSQ